MPEPIRTILAAVDFSASSERALDYALAVAKRAGATLHVLHAWRAPPWSPPIGSLPVEQTTLIESALDSWRRSAERELDALRERAERDGVACRTHLEIGVASATIAQAVKELGADLALVGARGRSALAHVLLGSAAERVMRISTCPVAGGSRARPGAPAPAAPQGSWSPWTSRPRRVVPSGSRYASARPWGGRRSCCSTRTTFPGRSRRSWVRRSSGRSTRSRTVRTRSSRSGATRSATRVGGCGVSVVHERPEDAIVKLAEAEDADLITLGVHGHVPLAAALLGSVAERVVRRAPCPVGSVR